MRTDLSPLKLRTPSSAKHLLKKQASRMRPLASMATHLQIMSDLQFLQLATAKAQQHAHKVEVHWLCTHVPAMGLNTILR